MSIHKTPERKTTMLPFEHLEHTGLHCQGCGKIDPMGEHYDDCALKEPGDVLVKRPRYWWKFNDLTAEQSQRFGS